MCDVSWRCWRCCWCHDGERDICEVHCCQVERGQMTGGVAEWEVVLAPSASSQSIHTTHYQQHGQHNIYQRYEIFIIFAIVSTSTDKIRRQGQNGSVRKYLTNIYLILLCILGQIPVIGLISLSLLLFHFINILIICYSPNMVEFV